LPNLTLRTIGIENMLGAAIGDMVGEPFEFVGIKRKEFEPFLRCPARFTDDTICTAAVADSILTGKPPAMALRQWCQEYQNIGRWGQRFMLWFMADELQPPYHSAGNGSAMRISPVGFLAESEDQVIEWSDFITSVTHNHVHSLIAAKTTALAIYWFRNRVSVAEVRIRLEQLSGYDLTAKVDDFRYVYRRSELASQSVPQAIICALEATSFEDAVRNAVSLGGDADTQAAIAGAIAEARFGIPPEIAELAWLNLPQAIRDVFKLAYETVAQK
jgi:ADP-ribosyl-[dinitrogen reductase] hydrolase